MEEYKHGPLKELSKGRLHSKNCSFILKYRTDIKNLNQIDKIKTQLRRQHQLWINLIVTPTKYEYITSARSRREVGHAFHRSLVSQSWEKQS